MYRWAPDRLEYLFFGWMGKSFRRRRNKLLLSQRLVAARSWLSYREKRFEATLLDRLGLARTTIRCLIPTEGILRVSWTWDSDPKIHQSFSGSYFTKSSLIGIQLLLRAPTQTLWLSNSLDNNNSNNFFRERKKKQSSNFFSSWISFCWFPESRTGTRIKKKKKLCVG